MLLSIDSKALLNSGSSSKTFLNLSISPVFIYIAPLVGFFGKERPVTAHRVKYGERKYVILFFLHIVSISLRSSRIVCCSLVNTFYLFSADLLYLQIVTIFSPKVSPDLSGFYIYLTRHQETLLHLFALQKIWLFCFLYKDLPERFWTTLFLYKNAVHIP